MSLPFTGPSLLERRLEGSLPPNHNFGPHVVTVSPGDVVEFIISNLDSGNHPLHFHGHWMWCVGLSIYCITNMSRLWYVSD